eukprot:TRINITY_DN4774_c0_g2_i2.p1 TRINITY_DN4774_c0_g2~~TRINITY_DN4774_c0_g2_i2.p1  ORF type:complete len:180 (+),score=29.48 TRINITY_DN4774_c0_g2_i2:41-541(+)
MYNILFFGVLVAIIQSVNGISTSSRFITTDLLIVAGTAITVLTLYVQKIFLIANGDSRPTTSSSKEMSSTSSAKFSEGEEKELRHKVETLEDQVELLRESLATWKKEHEEISKINEAHEERYKKLYKKYMKATHGKKISTDNSLNDQDAVNLVDAISDTETSSLTA